MIDVWWSSFCNINRESFCSTPETNNVTCRLYWNFGGENIKNIMGFPGGSVVKNPPANTRNSDLSLSPAWVGKIALEKEMATHSSIVAWEIS